MSESTPKVGQSIKLKGCPEGISQIEEYEVMNTNRTSINIKSKDGTLMQIHKSRIAEIIGVPTRTTIPDRQLDTKSPKKEDKPIPFDANQWASERGGIHLIKVSEFDHKEYALTSHIAVDDINGFYYTVNVYKYPDGTISKGKKDSGGNKYPLRGHRITQPSKDLNNEPRIIKGTKTAEEVIKDKLKDGYVMIEKSTT
jgi:hypothetical protein